MKWILTEKKWKEATKEEKRIYWDGFFLGIGSGASLAFAVVVLVL
jgi:hypothetical protein